MDIVVRIFWDAMKTLLSLKGAKGSGAMLSAIAFIAKTIVDLMRSTTSGGLCKFSEDSVNFPFVSGFWTRIERCGAKKGATATMQQKMEQTALS